MNKYGSFVDTFLGIDHYNLVLAAGVPPADFSLNPSNFASSFLVGRSDDYRIFNLQDIFWLREAAIFSNLADGLIQNRALGSLPMSVAVNANRLGARLTGTISNTAGNAAVTGTATAFLTELSPGMSIFWIDNNNVLRVGSILSITSNTALTLTGVTASTGMFTGNTTSLVARPFAGFLSSASPSAVFGFIPEFNASFPTDIAINNGAAPYATHPLVGKIIIPAAAAGTTSTIVRGEGTNFTKALAPASAWLRYGSLSLTKTLRISSIDSDTQLTIAHPDPTGAPSTAGIPTAFSGVVDSTFLGFNAQYLALRASLAGTFDFTTLTMDSGLSGKNLSISSVFKVEHTFEAVGAF